MTPAELRLELLCAEKDAEIAQLRHALVVEHLRQCEGVPQGVPFDPQTRTFIVPPKEQS